jgi:hypothetical protein
VSLITKIKLGLSAARVANGPLAQVKGGELGRAQEKEGVREWGCMLPEMAQERGSLAFHFFKKIHLKLKFKSFSSQTSFEMPFEYFGKLKVNTKLWKQLKI